MDGIGLTVLAIILVGIGFGLWQRHRRQRLGTTQHSVRCPIHGEQAEVAVATDPAAPSCRQHRAVTSCSLRSNATIGLPERVAYLWDGPPCKVRMDPARSAVYSAEVPCPQHCLFVLNATAVSGALPPLECNSGVSDAIALAAQAVGSARMSRLLWYSSV